MKLQEILALKISKKLDKFQIVKPILIKRLIIHIMTMIKWMLINLTQNLKN